MLSHHAVRLAFPQWARRVCRAAPGAVGGSSVPGHPCPQSKASTMPERAASPLALASLGSEADRCGGGQPQEARCQERAADMWAPCPRVGTSSGGHARRGRRRPPATMACSTMISPGAPASAVGGEGWTVVRAGRARVASCRHLVWPQALLASRQERCGRRLRERRARREVRGPTAGPAGRRGRAQRSAACSPAGTWPGTARCPAAPLAPCPTSGLGWHP